MSGAPRQRELVDFGVGIYEEVTIPSPVVTNDHFLNVVAVVERNLLDNYRKDVCCSGGKNHLFYFACVWGGREQERGVNL